MDLYQRIMGMCVMGLFLLSAAEPVAGDEPLTARERALLQTVETLKEKVAELEARVKKLEGTVPPDVPARVDTLEKEVGKVQAAAPAGDDEFRVSWKDGLRFETKDGKVKLRVGGRMQNDYGWFTQDDDLAWIWDAGKSSATAANAFDGVEMRRARLYLSGQVYEDLLFKWEYDFAGGNADFREVYVGMQNVPVVGTVLVGHYKEPFSLEEVGSDNDITFLERALPNIFAPSYNSGVKFQNTAFNDRVNWAVGVFRETDNVGRKLVDGDANVTARVTGLPWYRDDGRRLLHVGASYSYRNPDGLVTYSVRPEAHLAPKYLSTGPMYVDTINLYGIESAFVAGPFSLQGEYILSAMDAALYGDLEFDGYYVQANYTLTGESRPYKKDSATFSGIKPNKNFRLHGPGLGAWELALRYSSIDLNHSHAMRAGKEDNVTVGLNWYLNPATRLMLNYVNADIEHDLYGGTFQALQGRLQFKF